MSKQITVAGVTVDPGKKALGVIEIKDFWADGQCMEIPFMVLHGSKPGKTLFIQVAQHGSEVMGLDAVRRLIHELDPAEMSGTLIYCLPNPLAFREKARATMFDPKPGGMNRIWPGNPEGSLTERMAHLILEELVSHVDEVVDLHCAGRHCPVWVYYEPDGVSELAPRETAERSEEMARLFGAPVLYVEVEAYGGRKTLRAICVDKGIPAIVPELGGHSHFDEEIIQLTHVGLRNIMIDLRIIEGEIKLPKKQVKLKWRGDPKISVSYTQKGGVFVPTVKLGDIVKKGDPVGFIYSPRTFETIETLYSKQDGYVFTIRENPVAHQGDGLVSVPEILGWLEN
ncbi:MAG: succinylglutamate desuccinylase/aspartoacylase family protein [Candidatus Bathyarchaeota archaeon]|nr:succinylglutamate desuccinylase/aspartoacylase family protein [Candidatus Bathyarchaeota archaeon]